jgi:hypothetical protein
MKPQNSFIVEYHGELIEAEEGYKREEQLDDESVFRYFIQHRRKRLW